MSQSVFNLAKGALDSVDAVGRFVFVEAAAGRIEVTALNEAGQSESIELNPREQARFETVFKKVSVRNMHGGNNAVTIRTAAAQLFTPQDGSAVTIAGQEVPLSVTQSGPVLVDSAVPVNVQIAGSGVSFPVYQIGQDQALAGTVTLGGSAHSFSANADRYKLKLKADANNTAAVWIGASNNGYPLEAGESVVIETSGALSVVGTSGEKLHWLTVGGV